MLPYGRQTIDDDDIQAVVDVLRSDFVTTGPKVAEFESALASFADAEFAVVVSNGTAALHCAMSAIGISPGDEVIVPTMTFAATANCVLYQGGVPVFADSGADDLLIDPGDVEKKITDRTKAVIAVDYAGQPCDYDALREICDRRGPRLISDACHSIGSEYKGRKTGSIADITCFSFHPVKHITTGEGGACLTNDAELAEKARLFRNHGITTDFRQREKSGGWFYEMTELGFNYRLTDIQCALGISQLRKLPAWLDRRREIAAMYDAAFANLAAITPLRTSKDVVNAYHLYVIKLSDDLDRDNVFRELRENGVGVNVHYIPVHLHPFYQRLFGTARGAANQQHAAPSGDPASSAFRNTSAPFHFTSENESCEDGRAGTLRPTFSHSGTPELRNSGTSELQNSRTSPSCPVAEDAYKRIISLPMFPAMTDDDVNMVQKTLKNIFKEL